MDLRTIAFALMLSASPFTVLAGEGHDAGYAWAAENDIDDVAYCNTPSPSFNEGCEEYVEEIATSRSDADDDDE
ncbi:hypothetical protein [Pseudomonas batumici]|uniref:Secreted protein n=1 Tax=Pseudomonas batumici TaxID=226910 RepID=A0A0C2I4E0_9PSED|nr:hypothetical protein [Pseudomonas batumici]KIH84076.1 hypothetical protein UCMB321_2076 [Pseudomonas batumici]